MIKYNLLCKKCELTFDSWFASSKEYDKLKKKKLISCHNCGSIKVEKSLMAPKLISKNFINKNEKKNLIKYQKIKKTIKEYQKFIKNNFDYVGENFAYEARSIHYNNKKKNKLKLDRIDGMNFNVLTNEWSVGKDKSVNYIAKFIKN